jgi:hypothetical protein
MITERAKWTFCECITSGAEKKRFYPSNSLLGERQQGGATMSFEIKQTLDALGRQIDQLRGYL